MIASGSSYLRSFSTSILRPLAAAAVAAAGLGGAAVAAEPGHQAFPFSYVAADKLAAADAAKAPGPRFRIISGAVAADGAWPWQVALVSNASDTVYNNQYCGGTLVTRTWVLTAAHCVYDEDDDTGTLTQVLPDSIKVLAGTTLLIDGQGELLPVARIYPHPDYDPVAIENDIALIELAHPPAIANVGPVPLPSREVEAAITRSGTPATVIGWGRMENGEYPVDLHQVGISILDRTDCNRNVLENRTGDAKAQFNEVRDYLGVANGIAEDAWQLLLSAAAPPITDNMVCSGTFEAARGSCNGDSGGPLMVALADGTYVQVGIVSWSFSAATEATCDASANFSAYTRVANYIDWIRDVIVAPPAQPMVPIAGAPAANQPGAVAPGVPAAAPR